MTSTELARPAEPGDLITGDRGSLHIPDELLVRVDATDFRMFQAVMLNAARQRGLRLQIVWKVVTQTYFMEWCPLGELFDGERPDD